MRSHAERGNEERSGGGGNEARCSFVSYSCVGTETSPLGDKGEARLLMIIRPKIGEILVRLKVLTLGDVMLVLEARERRTRRSKFGQTARDMGLVTEEQVLAAMAVQMRLLPDIEQLTLEQVLQALTTAEQPN